jgi:dipeptidyl-peptidase-3
MAKASWEGHKVCYFQRSYESPGLFLMIQDMLSHSSLRQTAASTGLTEDDWSHFEAYCAGVLANAGNYRGFGDTKFIPELDKAKFTALIDALNSPFAKSIWEKITDDVYSLEAKQIGFPERGGASSYYTPNVTVADTDMIKRFLESQKSTEFHINSRLWKTEENRFEIKIASVVTTDLPIQGEYQFEGNTIAVKAGDFSSYMRSVVDNLSAAVQYAANDTQRMMLGYYINHFLTGDIETHKNS